MRTPTRGNSNGYAHRQIWTPGRDISGGVAGTLAGAQSFLFWHWCGLHRRVSRRSLRNPQREIVRELLLDRKPLAQSVACSRVGILDRRLLRRSAKKRRKRRGSRRSSGEPPVGRSAFDCSEASGKQSACMVGLVWWPAHQGLLGSTV